MLEGAADMPPAAILVDLKGSNTGAIESRRVIDATVVHPVAIVQHDDRRDFAGDIERGLKPCAQHHRFAVPLDRKC